MFVCTDIVLLSWLHCVLLKRYRLKFILCLDILQKLFSFHEKYRYRWILVSVTAGGLGRILLLIWLTSHYWKVCIVVLGLQVLNRVHYVVEVFSWIRLLNL